MCCRRSRSPAWSRRCAGSPAASRSFAAIWLVVVPLEAALSASRRVVALASTFALVAAGLLLVFERSDPAAAADGSSPMNRARSRRSASSRPSLYATGLALGAESLARTSFWLLYAEEDRYRLLARNMTDVITRHGRNGAVLFVSPAAEQLFGVPVARLHGPWPVRSRPRRRPSGLSDARSPMPPRSARRARSNFACAATPRRRRPRRSAVHLGRNALPAARRAPSSGETDDARGGGGHARRHASAKLQEQALDDARAEAERANAAKGRFLATMSHELRTPLNAIIGFSDMLTNERRCASTPRARAEYAQLINESGHHLLSVVNGILDMSKMETGNFEITPEPFAPAQVIGGCCDLLALKAQDAGVTLKPRVCRRPAGHRRRQARAQADPDQSALQRDQVHRPRRQRDGRGRADGGRDRDHGRGQRHRHRRGRPAAARRGRSSRRAPPMTASTTAPASACRSCKGLVRLHGGEMEIASRLGEGTRVTVRLPIDCEGARPAEPITLVPQVSDQPASAAPIAVKKSA